VAAFDWKKLEQDERVRSEGGARASSINRSREDMVFLANQPIQYAESSDGTRVAYRRFGSGTPVVFVGGALSTAEAAGPLAAAFAEAGLQGVIYDRRGRGDSGDTAPYAPEREAEDLRAVIDAVDGAAVVLGHSSGAVLSLFAAAEGVPMTHLFLSEPPLRFGQNEPPADLPDRLQALVDQRENEEAVLLFLREDVGMPEPAIEQLRASPAFAGLVPLAQTTVYDNRLVASVLTPRRPDGAVDRHRRRATCCRDAGDGACGRAGVTRPWRRPHRHRSRGARPNRLIIAVRGAARTVGRTRAA
jgi:Alpha/beta hydrolase family